jgi:hypothetical protein
VAIVTALAASPLVPTGFARSVDPRRGFHLDLLVVGLAVLGWVLLVGAVGAGLAWRHGVTPRRGLRPPVAGRLTRRLPLRARLGCEAALAPVRSPGGAATRSAIVAAVVGVTGVIGVATFSASLSHLLAEPALQGWSFDAAVVNSDTGLAELRRSLPGLGRDENVAGIGWASINEVEVAGRATEVFAFDPDGGGVHPTMRAGRPPLADDEIVLGADSMRDADVAIGDDVVVRGLRGRARLRVVGSAVYPELGDNGDLSHAASITRRAAARVGAIERGSAALVRLEPGRGTQVLARYGDAGELVATFRPPRVRNLEEVGAIPWVLGAFLAALGLAAIAHGMLRSVRTRRHDLAVLATLGLGPRDLGLTVCTQAACVASIGIAIGTMAGLFFGRMAWSAVATASGVVDRLVVPVTGIALVAAAALACSLLVALLTFRAAAFAPAKQLRAE